MNKNRTVSCLRAIFLGIIALSLFVLTPTTSFGQLYKKMMNDPSVNFYDAVQEAENYFQTHEKGKGSGWKPYQRWLAENEHKYYPSGDRSTVDPYFVSKSFNEFKAQNPSPESLFNTGWEDLGPNFVEQITGHYSIGLGRITAFHVDPNNNQRLYLGSRAGGFWKTIDGGTTWQGGSTDFLNASGVNTITASPTNSDSVLINIRNSTNGASHGIYRSIDGGDSWTLTAFNPTNIGWGGLGDNDEIFKIAYHPTIPNLIYIGTSKGIYISNDNLATWTRYLNTSDITDFDFHPTNPNIIYVYDNYYWGTNQNVILVSTDGGVNYTASSALTGNSDATCHLSVSPACPNCVYVASGNGIWKSTNSGVNFSFVSNPSQNCIGGFAVSDLNTNNILYGYVDTEMSTDGGVNFTQTTFWSLGNTNGAGSGNQTSYNTSTDYVHADLQEAECHNGVFYVASDGFLCKSSDNGITWQILSNGTGIRMNYNLGVSQSNHYRTVCGSQDNGSSIKHQSTWIEFTGGDGMEGIIHPLNDDWMISSYQYGSRRRTKDGGLNGSSVTPPGQNGQWIAPMFYDPNNQMTVYSLGENVHRSDDFGSTWATLGTPSFTGTIKFATIAENNSNVIVVCQGKFIELSSNGGATFTNIKGTLPNYSITDVVFDPNDDDVIVVTYARYQTDNSKVFITMNQGATWQNITYNLGNMPVRSVVIDHTDASTIYLGTEIGVYKKAMTDNTWSLYNPDLPNMSIKELEVMWGSNTLRAATWGRGLWEYALDGRVDFPTILKTTITNPPTDETPKEGVDQYVTSNITYDNSLTSVYLEWSLNTPTFGNVINMSNTTGTEWVSDSPLPDQPIGTKIFFKVFAVGNTGDTTETYKFMYVVKPFVFCGSLGSSTSGNLYLEQITVSSMTNTTLNDTYTYYLDSLIELELSTNYTITLDANTGWSSNDFGAWIDYNQNALFESSEAILSASNAGGGATANFTVPTTAVVGDTLIMRIRLGYWDNPSLDPCGTTLGEVEDYSVIIASGGALPVKLLHFTATPQNKKVLLEWETATEINNNFFTIERSADSKNWIDVGRVDGAGNSNTIRSYSTYDYHPFSGISYYRLTQTDFDGTLEYSTIVSVNMINGGLIIVHPNPANNVITIAGKEVNHAAITVKNNLGQICRIQHISSDINTAVLNIENLDNGIYFIEIKSKASRNVLKLVVQR